MKTSSTLSAGTDTVTTLALSQMGILNKKKSCRNKAFLEHSWWVVGLFSVTFKSRGILSDVSVSTGKKS